MLNEIEKIKNLDKKNFFLIAGPCIIESKEEVFKIAKEIKRITDKLEIPFIFKERQNGESKMDGAVTLEYFGLILARLTGGTISIRFVLFLLVGLTGVLVQLLMVGVFLNLLKFSFFYSQIFAVIAAMTSNFFLNNMLTYRDQALSGKRIFLGLLSFYFVCSIGAIANVAVANLVYSFVSLWILASFLGSVMSSLWNFMSSKWLTWRIR